MATSLYGTVGKPGSRGAPEKKHRIALYVDQNDPDIMKLPLNNARNVYDLYQERGETIAIEIVTYSQGLHMLRDDSSPVKAEIRELRKKIPQVAFAACNNTKAAMEKREGKPALIVAEATIVLAGVVRLLEL